MPGYTTADSTFDLPKPARSLTPESTPGVETEPDASRTLRQSEQQFSAMADNAPPIARPHFNSLREVRGYLGNVVNVTDLEETLRRQPGLLQISHDAILVWRLGGGIEFWSKGAVELYGYEPHEALGRAPQELLRTVDAHPSAHIETELRRDGFWQGELRQMTRNGKEVFVSCRRQLVHHSGEATFVFESNRDITEARRLQQEIVEISEREKNRIGQDLHDVVCQQLAGIEFRLLGLRQKAEGKTRAQVVELARHVRDAIEQTRNLAHCLSPMMMSADGLMNCLQALAFNTSRTFNVACTFICPERVLIPDIVGAMHLYRIGQEAVQNALRHGKATVLTIELSLSMSAIVLAIRDNGVGLPDDDKRNNGMGLRVMRYRAQLINGTLGVQRQPQGGTSVICSVPQGGAAEPRPRSSSPNPAEPEVQR